MFSKLDKFSRAQNHLSQSRKQLIQAEPTQSARRVKDRNQSLFYSYNVESDPKLTKDLLCDPGSTAHQEIVEQKTITKEDVLNKDLEALKKK